MIHKIRIACAAIATFTCSVAAQWDSFPIGNTVPAGGRDSVFRVTNGLGGAGTLNLFGGVFSDANEIRMSFITANHVVAGTNVASIDFRGLGHAGTFNMAVAPASQIRRQIAGEDLVYIGLVFSKTTIGAANFATLQNIAPLTVAADAGGNHTFQEWGYGVSATPDTINGTPYPFVHHRGVAAEQYGTLRTFTNQLTANNVRASAAGGLTVRDFTWDVFGPQVLALVGSGAPGDSGAGLSDLAGAGTTISGILTGGTDTAFDAAGNVVDWQTNNTWNRIAWRAALGNTDRGFGLGFTPGIVIDLNAHNAGWIPAPGVVGFSGFAMLFAFRRRRS